MVRDGGVRGGSLTRSYGYSSTAGRQLGNLLLVCSLLMGCRNEATHCAASGLAQWVPRPIEARLSVSNHHPCRRTEADSGLFQARVCSELPPTGSRDFERLSSAVRRLSTSDCGDHAEGLSALVFTSLPGATDTAIGKLSSAHADDPTNEAVANDLAAAFYHRGVTEDRPADVVEALQILLTVETTKPSRALLFNKALALTQLGLLRQALEAWSVVEMTEESPDWAAEANRRRLDIGILLERDEVDNIEDRFWRVLEGLLPSLKEGPRARLLSEAAQIGHDFRLRGDSTLADGVDRLAAAIQSRSAAAEPTIAALELMGAARRAQRAGFERSSTTSADDISDHERWTVERAAEGFARSAKTLCEQGSPFCVWPLAWGALLEIHRDRHAAAERTLDELDALPARWLGPVARSRSSWYRGLSQSRRGARDVGLALYQRALTEISPLGLIESEAWLHDLVAENLQLLGASDSAWPYRIKALRLIAPRPQSVAAHNTLVAAALAANSAGAGRAALAFANEAVFFAVERQRAVSLTEVFLTKSRLEAASGLESEARKSLTRAYEELRRVQAPFDEQLSADLALHEARLNVESSPDTSLLTVSKAMANFKDRGRLFRTVEAAAISARAHTRAGHLDLAADQIRFIVQRVADIASQRSPHGDAWDPSVGEVAQPAFEDAVRFYYFERNDPRTALLYALAARSVAMGRTSQALDADRLTPALDRVQSNLGRNDFLLVYFFVPERLIGWRISATAIEAADASARSVRAAIKQLLAAKSARRLPDWEEAAERLADLLQLQAISNGTSPGTLWIVPDRELAQVPFSVLRPGGGDLILRNWEVAYVVEPLRLGRLRSWNKPRSALVVGDPAFDSVARPELPRLPQAAAEAEQIAGLYDDAQVLLGTAATETAILDEIRNAEILHFAGHAVPIPSRPGESHLLVAKGDSEPSDGVLTAIELKRQSLDDLQLAVLASCESNLSGLYRAGPAVAIAAPFITNGSQGVIGSQWKVEDAPTVEIMRQLHERLAHSDSPARALRQAKLWSVDRGIPAWSWGAFTLLVPRPRPWHDLATATSPN